MTETYTFEIAMDHPLAVNINEPFSNTHKLVDFTIINDEAGQISNTKLTSPGRSASGYAFTKSLMFPWSIQSDIIANRVSDIVTPINGRTFGC